MTSDLTAREVAELSGAPKRTIEKAVEEGVFRPVATAGRRRGGRVLPNHAVAYALVIGKLRTRLDLASKHRLAARLAGLRPATVAKARFELEPAVEIDVGRLVGDGLARTARYLAARGVHIVIDDGILGGTPVIRGTRLSVYSVLGRVADGDTLDDLLADNPDVAREALEAAVIYARSHPLVGRPGGRPWATPA
ncbi:MAG TPA: DUF433 domain-containing protein [Caulobacteraceae bacterium]|nr:DUF433 domain-containing protein [Caulobacteraceae bacterium]